MFGYCARSSCNSTKLLQQTVTAGYGAKTVTTLTPDTAFNTSLENAKPFSQVPHLPMVPILGSSWVYLPIIGKYHVSKLHLADFHKYETYGNIVREKIGSQNIVSTFVPEVMELLHKNEGPYPNRGILTSMKTYRESRKKWYKNTGVIVMLGKEWKDLRTKTQKHLMKPKAIQAYLNPMQDVAKDLVRRMFELRNNSNKEVPAFLEELYKWALESVGIVGLDTRLGCLDSNLRADSDGRKMIQSVQCQFDCMNKLEVVSGNFQFWKYFPSPTYKKYEKACDTFTEIAFKHINNSLEELKRTQNEDKERTLLQSMLMTEDLDVSDIVVTVGDMLFAGVDTTSHSVGYLLYNLARNPEKQQILYDEIKRLLPNKEDRITPTVFNELRYLKSCMKESMRLHPIVRGNTRIFDHDVVILGYRIPAGTMIFCMLHVIYRNEKYFKNPESFLPERWLDKDQKPSNPYAYVPFGHGIRSCLGRRLAELEILTLSVEILRNFKVEYHYEDIGMFTRMVNVPDRPLKFKFIERQ